jgi:chorismate-pyruvate lyase
VPPLLTAALDDLYDLFPDRSDEPSAELITADDLPEPYRRLLAHRHHMTVTVEQFYGGPVDVTVLEVWQAGDDYARKILLTLRDTGKVVQFGIVRIDLRVLAPEVRRQIEEKKTPLGRVLIQHDVLRTVNPTGYYRITPSPALAGQLGMAETDVTYGRIGVITADGKPAVRVAEILTPIV